MWRLLLLLLGGCDIVLGLQQRPDGGTGDAIGDGPPPPVCAGNRVLAATFDNLAQLATDWNRSMANGAAIEVTGTIAFTTGAPLGYANLGSIQGYNFDSAIAQVEVVDTNVSDYQELYFALYTTDINTHFMQVTYDGSVQQRILAFKYKGNGVIQDSAQLPYDPLAHRYWRMTQNRTLGVIEYATSADGMMWTKRAAHDTRDPLDQVHVDLGSGAYAVGNPTASTSKLDNFSLCLP